MVNKFQGLPFMMAFLCGGIEYAPEGGRAWRIHLRAWLEENLNHHVYDHALEGRRVLGEAEWAHDLDVVTNRTDYVIAYWDEPAVQGGESSALLTAAHRKGIPVYFVTEIPIEQIGGWVVGCTTKIFSSFEELKSFLTATYISEVRQRALRGSARGQGEQ
ncbi:MAG: hypothetical protein DMG21_04150 [Acidobacteria bacterium]|nr:MAG: hypothetical protein DMG21_04150 [Acidobacteriota bacterium]